MVKRVCSQCPEPHLAKGLCRKHYNARWYLADRSHQRELGKARSAANKDHLREYHANRRQSPDTRAHVLELDAKSRERKRGVKGFTLGDREPMGDLL